MFTDGSWMGHGIGMWLFWIILIIVVVLLLRVVTGNGGSSGSSSNHQQSPLEILKARYARGEIDEEEFSRRKKELES